MCHADKISGKRQTTEGVKLRNQESIGTLGEKKKYKYLGVWKANPQQAEIKENIRLP